MKIGQVALGFGADDMGSVMIEENVVSAAGTTIARRDESVHLIRSIGKIPVQREAGCTGTSASSVTDGFFRRRRPRRYEESRIPDGEARVPQPRGEGPDEIDRRLAEAGWPSRTRAL